MNPVSVIDGEGPVILGQPHCGTFIPDDIRAALNDTGARLSDTDWHVDRLYDGLLDSASIVRANFHRYVIDANRDPSGQSLYPGQSTTGLVPETTFDGEPIWRTPLTRQATEKRLAHHRAYHDALHSQVGRVRARHGVAILYDCHSIRSEIPNLFEGRLPDFNLGDNSGATCAPEIMASVMKIVQGNTDYSHVVNGRFRGGWTTRHYGRPEHNVHAIQMELAQRCYLVSETPPYRFCAERAAPLRALLKTILEEIESIASFMRD